MYVGRTLLVRRSTEANELLSVIFDVEDARSEDVGPGWVRLNPDDPEDNGIQGQHPLRFRLRDGEEFLIGIYQTISPNVGRVYQKDEGLGYCAANGGSYGSVYKGILDQEENIVAIKVLHLQQKGAEKSFIAECNAVRNIRHRTLVKILTCCSSVDYHGNEFKALVFEFMPNGKLEKWLHHELIDGNILHKGLSMIQRPNIAVDVASAIYYLHEDCAEPIIYCDLKPSNILLDNELVAHVSDFGLARLISNTTGFSYSQTTGIMGTIGYAPPEYAMGSEPSRKGRAYSYGILLLEMFTGKRPADEMFKDDFNLHNFVKKALPEGLVQIADSALLPREVDENCGNSGGIEIDEED
ncbi:probable LRR receptor-like serine/threonine-protein kinase At3g47570 [Morus notabilis]|uniref:probable LRR receptor-like serine/threonine-protein kinase At3g47570 n=1 Tax=Morus notabilis TaxID=981085 RepID=UPI000CED1D09|nr:probable LRR receptor-like serine/threonine-protein kinase At3g47570 [Morus notabilis]